MIWLIIFRDLCDIGSFIYILDSKAYKEISSFISNANWHQQRNCYPNFQLFRPKNSKNQRKSSKMANCAGFTFTNHRRYNRYDIWFIIFKADIWAWVLIFEKISKFNFFFWRNWNPVKVTFTSENQILLDHWLLALWSFQFSNFHLCCLFAFLVSTLKKISNMW